MTRTDRVRWELMLLLAALLPSFALAQATGAISGVVSDPSGAPLPGATVSVVNNATGQTRVASTSADGFFTVPLLQPGSYRVTASLQGFSTLIHDGIRVTVSETARVNLQLPMGGRAEDLTVVGEAPLVETSNATMGIVIDEQKVVDLPLNGRNFTQLGTLIPGVVAPPPGLGGAAGDATPGGFGAVTSGFNVNGMRNQSNNFLLDGATNNDTFNTGFVLRPPPDAIQEFKILTHSYNAEYGRNAGSVVNVVTRSGSNSWHGAAWEFNRDDGLQAYNFFAARNQPKPTLKQNQFGASLGGPLKKDKLFVFAYYEGYRNTSGTTQNLLVPSAEQRAGNFAGATILDPRTGLPFPGGIIPSNRLDPSAQRLLNDFMPLPNSPGNRYVVSPDVVDNRDQAGGRLDYRWSDRHQVLARYLWSQTDRTTPRVQQPADAKAVAKLWDVMLADTYMFSSTLINQARFSMNKIDAQPAVTSGRQNSEYGLNVPNTNPLAVGLPSIAISGFPGLGDPQQPFVQRNNDVWQLTDDLTWLRGRHSLKFGIDVRKERMFIAFINRPNGDYTFSSAITGNALADFLLGVPAQFRRTTQQTIQDGHGYLYAGYVQDEFRVSDRLTLNLGLRYEVPKPFVDEADAIAVISPGSQSTKYAAAPQGLLYPGDAGIPRGGYATDTNNLAPRLAAIWDPRGDGKTSVRAAWGIFYDALAGQGDFFQSGVLAPPFTPLLELNATRANPFLTLQNPLSTVTGGPSLFPPNLTIIGWGPEFDTPSAMHYNLTVQQQIGKNLGVELGYVGSRGRNLPIFMEINPIVTPPGTRKYTAYSLLRPTFSEAESWYNSLQASARLRPTKGLNFLASYTLGHAVDHVSGLNIGGEPRPALPVTIGDDASIQRSLAYEKGDALFDVRHRFVFSFGYELPKLQQSGAAVRHLLGGWQLNGIFQAQTGFPFTVSDPVLDIYGMTSRPNMTCDPNEGAPHTVEKWFNTECFQRRPVAATAAGPGDQEKNSVRGPGMNRIDMSLFKNFNFAKQHVVQVRVEAFNLFNHARFGQPVANSSAANFGAITSADDGRVIQLGIKYSF
jgi:outer membrane receptor protein involved in Fe transport